MLLPQKEYVLAGLHKAMYLKAECITGDFEDGKGKTNGLHQSLFSMDSLARLNSGETT